MNCFDPPPAGQSMPLAAARKIEYFSRKNDLDLDIRLYPLNPRDREHGNRAERQAGGLKSSGRWTEFAHFQWIGSLFENKRKGPYASPVWPRGIWSLDWIGLPQISLKTRSPCAGFGVHLTGRLELPWLQEHTPAGTPRCPSSSKSGPCTSPLRYPPE